MTARLFGIRISAAYALMMMGSGVQLPFLPLWLKAKGIDNTGIAMVVAGMMAVRVFGAPLFAWIADHFGNRRLVRGGLAIAIIGAGLFAIPGLAPWPTLAGLVLLGLGAAPLYPSLMHETTRRFDANTARRVVGRQVAFASVGAAIGPAALGLLGAHLGLGAIMPVVLLSLLVLALMVWRLDQVT